MKSDRVFHSVFTVPNLLSCFRIALIPAIAWLYCLREDFLLAGLLLILSGLTDIADGFIARRFHMISDVGKVLDPIADKLTQTVVLLCLLTRFPAMAVPLILLVVKELFMTVTGFLVIRITGAVMGAQWHGKAATFLLDAMMILHIFWPGIPAGASNLAVAVCTAMICLSFVLYGLRNLRALARAECRREA